MTTGNAQSAPATRRTLRSEATRRDRAPSDAPPPGPAGREDPGGGQGDRRPRDDASAAPGASPGPMRLAFWSWTVIIIVGLTVMIAVPLTGR